MRNIVVTGFIAAPLLTFAMAMPSFAADPAPTTCKDGTTTTSTGKGTCSGHGGVQKAAKAAAPAAAAPAAPAASTRRSGGRRNDDLRRRHDLNLDRQGHLQRSWRGTKGSEGQAGHCGCDARRTGGCRSGNCRCPAAAPAASTTAAKSSTATKSAPTTAASNTDPTGATAKCKDGTYSKSTHHSGTCSSHGGVAEWLTAAK